MSISKNDVYAACRQLEASGETITNAAVRDVLGRGSLTTITPLVRSFRTERRLAIDMPDELDAVAADLARRFWLVAKSEAAATFKTERGQAAVLHEASLERLAKQLASSRSATEEARKEASFQSDCIQRLELEITSLKQEVQDLTGGLETSKVRLANAEERKAEADARATTLQTFLEHERASHHARSIEAAELRARLEVTENTPPNAKS